MSAAISPLRCAPVEMTGKAFRGPRPAPCAESSSEATLPSAWLEGTENTEILCHSLSRRALCTTIRPFLVSCARS